MKERKKIMKKKVLAMVLSAVCAMGLLAGCGLGNDGNTTQGQGGTSETTYTIGISQFAEHGSIAVRAFWQDLRMQELKKEKI